MQREWLRERLLDRQGDAADGAFGAMLGLSASGWSHIKSGRRLPSDNLIRRLRLIYPDLDEACVAALLEERSDSVA